MHNRAERAAVGNWGRKAAGRLAGRLMTGMLTSLSALFVTIASAPAAHAADDATTCARVKIEIKQELSLERQAFDAEMKISNAMDGASLSDVKVVVKFTDEAGVPVEASSDSSNTTAKFFIRVSSKDGISDVDGAGVVNASSTAIVNWLIIPAPGSAGPNPAGKKYLVGATLTYKFGGESFTLDVSPDVITVKPLPKLTLDYFLTQDVIADDPSTQNVVEPPEPFTLGVRVKNTGYAAAKNLKIDSAQPKITENTQGLLINFKIDGSYLNDAPAQNTLLINFGEIAAGSSKMGRWIMETTLAGKFIDFSAKFSHSDELGGALTSIMDAVNAHLLIRDVRVDLPGRDAVRDFLAKEKTGDALKVYESDGPDSDVTDRSAVATVTAGTNAAGNASYHVVIPPTAGFVYVKLADPFGGTKALGQMLRSDAKVMLAENVWLSKERDLQAKVWHYYLNVFDANTTGVYDIEFKAPPQGNHPPVLQFIPDHIVKEEHQVSFLVEASSADGKPLTLSAAPLPAGATFTQQAADPGAPGMARAIFDWTPPKGTAGSYLIVYTANDGTLSANVNSTIKVESAAPPPGPGTPTIDAPSSGAQVAALKPTLSVNTSTDAQDPTTQVQFEVYADEAMTQLVASATVNEAPALPGSGGTTVPQPTQWTVPSNLNDNTLYWWRARAYDGTLMYSPWVNGRFMVNLFNDAPDTFNLTSPASAGEVATAVPTLAWTNAVDKDGDAITYTASLYRNAALTDVVATSADIQPDASGTTTWAPTAQQLGGGLTNHAQYYWRVVAKDALGATTLAPARAFSVNTGNTAPTAPVIVSPAVGGQNTSASAALTIQNSTDAEADLLTYVFEIDTVNTFDSGNKRTSGQVVQNAGSTTLWLASGLVENQHYYWRAKAQDGRAESAWVLGDFTMNAVNDPPPVPTVKNPGNGAWSASQQPTFEANPVVDPEGSAVTYQFEVYRDQALTNKVTEGSSTNGGWISGVALADKTTHWWRIRAVDAQGVASAWSAASVLYVSTGPYQAPTIQLTAPAVIVKPDATITPAGHPPGVQINWEGVDPNIEPTIALYYGTDPNSYSGTLIADGLRQAAGSHSGSYVWEVNGLAPGAYYVYGVIYDAKGVGKAFAAGAVVVPTSPQGGNFIVSKTALTTSEAGSRATYTVRATKAPRAPVRVSVSATNPHEDSVVPAMLTFTAQNWTTPQTVTVTGQDDCVLDGNVTHKIMLGKASTLDPDYVGVQGPSVNVTNTDSGDKANTTTNPALHICLYTQVTETQIDAFTWEYVMSAKLTNTGAPLAGVQATVKGLPAGTTVTDAALSFGAVGTGETVNSADTFTFRRTAQLPFPAAFLKTYAKWTVVATPAP